MLECSICSFTIPQLRTRQCSLCELVYHETCYFETRPKKQQDCQACAHVMLQREGKKHKIEPECYVCKSSGGSPLKEIESDRFCHIMCAITSNGFQVQSYKEFRIREKKNAESGQCDKCKITSPHLLECQLCPYKSHFSCLDSEQNYVGQHLSSNLNLNILFKQVEKQKVGSSILDTIRFCLLKLNAKESSFSLLSICQKQTKKYCWCFCGNSKINDEEKNPSIVCDKCYRYVHLSCTGMKDPQQIDNYECPGCKIGDKYKKYARLPDLIQDLIRLENGNFKVSDLKIIDSIPYVFSERLKQNIRKQSEKVINYLAIKTINQMASSIKKQHINPTKFYQLVKFTVGERLNSSPKQLWQAYCQMLIRMEPSMVITVSSMNPPITVQQQNPQQVASQEKFIQYIERCQKVLKQDRPVLEIPNIVNYIRLLRQIVRKSNTIRDGIDKNLDNNLLMALLTFKCSAASEESIIDQLLNNFFKVSTMSSQEIQKMESFKRKGLPNFQVDVSWKIILKQIAISESSGQQNKTKVGADEQQSKICEDSDMEAFQILAKVLESRQTNPKIYGITKKLIAGFQALGTRQKKIKLLYQWSLLSKKIYFGLEKKKLSISGVIFASKLMQMCSYPANSLSRRLSNILDNSSKIQKVIKRVIASQNVQRETVGYELFHLINKPTLNEIKQALFMIKQTRHPQMWADLEKFELQKWIQECEDLNFKVKASLNFKNGNKIYQQNVIQPFYDYQPKLSLNKRLGDFPIAIVNPEEHYQITNLGIQKQILERMTRWVQKKQQSRGIEQDLIKNLQCIFEKAKQIQQFKDLKMNQILTNKALEKYVLNHQLFANPQKKDLLCKHIDRNKKWLDAATNLKEGKMNTLKYEQFCCLENKIKTSIFDHSQILSTIFTPIRKDCKQIVQSIQEIVPYCKEMSHSFTLKENIYNPNNKLYKRVKQLIVKQYSIRVYEKDCEILKHLTNIQQRTSKKIKEDIKNVLKQFEEHYKSISPYLHQTYLLWDLVAKIFQKLIQNFKETKSERTNEDNSKIYQKILCLYQMFDFMAEHGQLPEYKRRSEEIKKQLDSEE